MTTSGTNTAESYFTNSTEESLTPLMYVPKQYTTICYYSSGYELLMLPPEYLCQLFWVSTGHSQAISPPTDHTLVRRYPVSGQLLYRAVTEAQS